MSTVRDRDLRNWLIDRRQRLQTAIEKSRERDNLMRLVQEVDSTLERMNKGTYGLCEICNEPIEEERLIADPLIRTCLDHLTPDQQRALEQDLNLAWRIQAQMLPQQNLSIPGWEINYHYEPAGPVSGDYCDVISPKPESEDLYFLLGDVSGKGVAASMLMSSLHATFRSLIAFDLPVNKLVEQANRLFCESTLSTDYATLVCGKIRKSGEVEICNAGHPPPLLVQQGKIVKLEATGLPVGLFCRGEYRVKKTRLLNGESLVLYTDGLTEAQDRSRAEYSEERLAKFLKEHHHMPPQVLTSACLDDVRAFLSGSQKTDDLTIMVIRRTG
jgi:sigma-B regulation protein RsbU (phosphoserine phosphatase)